MKNYKTSLLSIMLFTLPLFTFGQTSVPEALKSLVGLPLDEAQEKLQSMNYEIASSSLFKKNQQWYNEGENVCIVIAFNKKGEHLVESIDPGVESECKEGVEKARKIWENYHDGQASVASAAIDRERDKLKAQGYTASYWIHDVSPGKTMEVWINESEKLSKSISWNDATKSEIKVMDRDFKYAKNPSPLKD